MPKYKVEYGFDVPAYGEVEIELDTEDQEKVIKHIKELYNKDELIGGWDTAPDVGCENHRVVHVFREHGDPKGDFHNWQNLDWGYFDLTEDDYYENDPALWIVYDDDSGSIMGHATKREDAVAIAEQLSDVRILKARM
jgi:hypothetical protein